MLTVVRCLGTLDDYTGELSVEHAVQITDRQNGPGQNEPATVQPFQFKFAVPCAATARIIRGRATAASTTGWTWPRARSRAAIAAYAYDGARWSCLGNPYGSEARSNQIHALDTYRGRLHATTWPEGRIARFED